jgi:hypothetical protein
MPDLLKIDDSHYINPCGLFYIFQSQAEGPVTIVYDFGFEKMEISAKNGLNSKQIHQDLKGSLFFKGRGPQFLIVGPSAKFFTLSREGLNVMVDSAACIQFEDEDDAINAFREGMNDGLPKLLPLANLPKLMELRFAEKKIE